MKICEEHVYPSLSVTMQYKPVTVFLAPLHHPKSTFISFHFDYRPILKENIELVSFNIL